jgi:hypothetical protein
LISHAKQELFGQRLQDGLLEDGGVEMQRRHLSGRDQLF